MFDSARRMAWPRSVRSAAGRPPGCVQVEISMFSATVRSGKIPLSSGEKARPRRAISCVRRRWISSSRNRMRPARGRRYPMMARRVVDLPAPLRPTRQTTSRSFTSSETRRRMWLDWMKTSMASTLSTGASRSSRTAADHHVYDPRVGADRGGGRVGQHPTLVEGDDPVRVAEHDVHVVLDLDDGLEADSPGRADQDLHDRVLVCGAHPAGRLVEQDDLGPEGEGGGHVEELLVALGQGARGRVGAVGETEEVGHLERLPLHLPIAPEGGEEAAAATEPRHHRGLERLQHGEVGEDLHELEAPGHAEPGEGDRADAPDVAALEPHVALARREDTGEQVDQGGLAGAVGTDDRDELAFADGKADPVEGDEGPVALPEIVRLEDHRRETRPMRPPGATITMNARIAPKISRQ